MSTSSAAARPASVRPGSAWPTFQAAAARLGFELDDAQREAIGAFERLLKDLERPEPRLLGLLARRRRNITGLYLWGSVGRGKSFLMDEFFRQAPVARKRRVHFHRFMQELHAGLRGAAGHAEPLRLVADQIVREARLLCLDELQITDIGDAMLMRGLLEALFERGVTLVVTSNEPPEGLYRDGLQRSQFLPAIALMQQQLQVHHLDAGRDYRLAALAQSGVWHWPLGDSARMSMAGSFVRLAGEDYGPGGTLHIEGRGLPAFRLGERAAWFDFDVLCGGPRGTADYIELARRYAGVLVYGVPQFDITSVEAMRRFTWMIDEFYDRHVKLVAAAQSSVEELYARVPARVELERTRSRLVEMRGADFLASAHLG